MTNFQPNTTLKDDFNFEIYNNKTNKILCKNFIIFVIFMKYINNKNNKNIITFFIKPYCRYLLTMLRPPYRHKISRHQLTFSRYFIIFTIKIPLSDLIMINNLNQLVFFFKNLRNLYVFFETNICLQHQSRITIFFKCNDFFKLMNYK